MARDQPPSTQSTDLEAAVLGVVWRDGPCTPYAIRQHFKASPSPRWSGSAGAIYPLIKRLESRGWVASTASANGRRRQMDYRITPDGKQVLRHWLQHPVPECDTALLYDPLRTRMFFLAALPTAQARKVIDEALDQLQTHLHAAEVECREPLAPGPYARLAARNALLLTRARIRWLREVQAELAAT